MLTPRPLLCFVPVCSGGAQKDSHDMYLYVGLANGVSIRSRVEESDGTLSDARKR